jgi:hypothetical protein
MSVTTEITYNYAGLSSSKILRADFAALYFNKLAVIHPLY